MQSDRRVPTFRLKLYQTARRHISEYSCHHIHVHENFRSAHAIFLLHVEHAGSAAMLAGIAFFHILLPLSLVRVLDYHFLRRGHVSVQLHELVSAASSMYSSSFDVPEPIVSERSLYVHTVVMLLPVVKTLASSSVRQLLLSCRYERSSTVRNREI